MAEIRVKTAEHILKVIKTPIITTGGKNTDVIVFEFDETWDFGNNVSFFVQFNKNNETYTYPLSNNTVTIPQEILAVPGLFSFSVFAKQNDETIRTSALCFYPVIKGSDAGAAFVDWNAFKRSLVNLLKSIFSFELDYDSTVEEILAVLSTAEDGAAVKKFFVDLLNFTVMGGFLDYDQSLDDISLNVTVASDRVNSELSDFSSLQNSLKRIYDNYLNDSSEGEIDIDPPYLFYMMAIEAYIQAETSIPDANEVNF